MTDEDAPTADERGHRSVARPELDERTVSGSRLFDSRTEQILAELHDRCAEWNQSADETRHIIVQRRAANRFYIRANGVRSGAVAITVADDRVHYMIELYPDMTLRSATAALHHHPRELAAKILAPLLSWINSPWE